MFCVNSDEAGVLNKKMEDIRSFTSLMKINGKKNISFGQRKVKLDNGCPNKMKRNH